MSEISYSIQNVGPIHIPLYPPADEVYSLLNDAGETHRLAHCG